MCAFSNYFKQFIIISITLIDFFGERQSSCSFLESTYLNNYGVHVKTFLNLKKAVRFYFFSFVFWRFCSVGVKKSKLNKTNFWSPIFWEYALENFLLFFNLSISMEIRQHLLNFSLKRQKPKWEILFRVSLNNLFVFVFSSPQRLGRERWGFSNLNRLFKIHISEAFILFYF